MPALRGNGKSVQEVASLFEGHTGKGKNFAYGLAEEIRDQLEAAASGSTAMMKIGRRR